MVTLPALSPSVCCFLFSVSATRLRSVFVRERDKVTLMCEAVVDQVNCNRTTWSFSRYIGSAAEDLVKRGKIVKQKALGGKLDKMTLNANCSLRIQRATAENVGRYFCQQEKQKQNPVDLSVVQSKYSKVHPKLYKMQVLKTSGHCLKCKQKQNAVICNFNKHIFCSQHSQQDHLRAAESVRSKDGWRFSTLQKLSKSVV